MIDNVADVKGEACLFMLHIFDAIFCSLPQNIGLPAQYLAIAHVFNISASNLLYCCKVPHILTVL